MKKASASLERMISIAWVFLTFALVILALIYVGVLDVDNFFPDRMHLGPGLTVKDMMVDADQVTFIFNSNLGRTLLDFRVNITECNYGDGVMSDPITVLNLKTVVLTMDCPNLIPVGDKFKSDLSVFYTTRTEGQDYTHISHGSIYVGVVEDVPQVIEWMEIIISGCTELNRPNTLYFLNQSLYNLTGQCFNITTEDNITLDLGGNEIVHEPGPTEGTGVWIRDVINTTVTNGTIEGFGVAVKIETSDNNTIVDINGTDNGYGIVITPGSDDNEIIDNEICNSLIDDFFCNGTGNYGYVYNMFGDVVNCSDDNVYYDLCPIIPSCTPGVGTGSSFDDPIILCNCTELQNVTITGIDKFYQLGCNMDCSNSSVAGHLLNNGGLGFIPIGTDGNRFTGGIDGAGHSLSGLYINSNQNGVGLFGYVDGAEIRNFSLVGADITGLNDVGGLIGFGQISTVTNSYFTGTVSGNNNIGGLIGDGTYAQVSASYATNAFISGNGDAGGLVGSGNQARVNDSYFNGDVTSTNNNAGGILGNGQVANITRSYSVSGINGDNHAGGLVGYGQDVVVKDSFSIANVNLTTSSENIGAVAGHGPQADVTNTYWYDYPDDDSDECVGVGPKQKNCYEYSADFTYYYNQANPPMNSWDINVWSFSGSDYPTLN